MSKTFLAVSLLFAGTFANVFAAEDGRAVEEPSPADNLEIVIGDGRYPVRLDEPVIVTTPKGEKLQFTLCRASTRKVEMPGFSCEADAGFKVEKEITPKRQTLTLLGKFRSFAIEYFPDGIGFDAYVKSYAEGFSAAHPALKFGDGGNYAAVDLGGERWVGKSFLSKFPPDEVIVSRIYRLERGGTWILVEQFLQSQRDSGEKYAELLRESFRFHAQK